MATAPLGFVAVLAGWTTTEAGRQPWVVYGHLRTADAVSPVSVHAVTFRPRRWFFVIYNLLLLFFPLVRRPDRHSRTANRRALVPQRVQPGIDKAAAMPDPAARRHTGVVPRLVSLCSTSVYKRRNQRDTSTHDYSAALDLTFL